MNTLFKLILLAVFCYVALVAGLYAFQRQLIYFPPATYYSPQQLDVQGFEEILMTTESGTRLTAWWSPPRDSGNALVMFFHGNAAAVYGYRSIYQAIQSAGFGIWVVSYPGYPGAGGSPSQPAIVNAAIEQYDYLLGKSASNHEIVFYGTSLGAAVAIQLATHRPPALLIAEAPFYSAVDMARRSFPIVPASMLLKYKFRSDLAIQEYSGPLLWLHGTADSVVPMQQGRRLFDSYGGEKRSLVLTGSNHTNVWESGGAAFILRELEEVSLGSKND